MDNEKSIQEALERAETACNAAAKAMDASDAQHAPALIYEVLAHTCEALMLASRSGKLSLLQNLIPNATHYIRVLTALDVDPFVEARKLTPGSSIWQAREKTDAERVADFLGKLAAGADGLSRLSSLLSDKGGEL